jgi:hypothetical protein
MRCVTILTIASRLEILIKEMQIKTGRAMLVTTVPPIQIPGSGIAIPMELVMPVTQMPLTQMRIRLPRRATIALNTPMLPRPTLTVTL